MVQVTPAINRSATRAARTENIAQGAGKRSEVSRSQRAPLPIAVMFYKLPLDPEYWQEMGLQWWWWWRLRYRLEAEGGM